MSADNGLQDNGAQAPSDISRREVLLTLGGVAAAVGAGAATWGGLELMVNTAKLSTVGTKVFVVSVALAAA